MTSAASAEEGPHVLDRVDLGHRLVVAVAHHPGEPERDAAGVARSSPASCLFDAPGIAVWRHDGEPEGPCFVVDVVEGFVLPDESIIGAIDSMPEGAPFEIELA